MAERAVQDDSSFTPVGVTAEAITRADRSAARSGYAVFRGQGGFEAAMPEALLGRMMALGECSAPDEWYGLLVGRLYDDGLGRHVVLLGVVPDPEASVGAGFVRTRFDSELRTRTAAALLYPDGVPVGWAHGHVRHGACFSATDFRNQATWTQPHAVGIVVDPFREPHVGVYRGPDGELLERVDAKVVGGCGNAGSNGGGNNAVDDPDGIVPTRRKRVWGRLRWLGAMLLVELVALLAAAAFFAWRGYEAELQISRLGRRLTSVEENLPTLSTTPPDAGAEAPTAGPP